jgi:hypothetical protein
VEEAGAAAAAARSSDTIVAAALDDAMVAIAGTVAVADGVGESVGGTRTPGLGGLVGVDGRKERGRNRRESGRGGGGK